MRHYRSSHLETLFNGDKESVETISLEERLFLVDNNALIEAANAMISDVEGISAGEECEGVGIINLVGASIGRQRHQNVVDYVQNLEILFMVDLNSFNFRLIEHAIYSLDLIELNLI